MDREDIDFEFEKIKNTDFEKLDDNDDDTRKLKPSVRVKPKNNKRKSEDTTEEIVSKKPKKRDKC